MKLSFLILVIATWAGIFAAPPSIEAAILFSETFDYPNGELQAASRGVWLRHSGDIDGPVVVDHALFIDDDGTKDYSRALGDFPPIKHGTVYAAFDLKVSTIDPPESTSSSAPYFANFSEEFGGLTPQLVSRLVMNRGAHDGEFRLGIARGGGGTATTTPWGTSLTSSVAHRVVVAYDLDAAVSTLWVDPWSAASYHVTNTTGIGLPIIGLNWFSFRVDGTSANSGDKTVDNLIVATTFEESWLPPPNDLPSADFNGDGKVNAADLVVWKTYFPSATGHTIFDGDADHDGDVDGADFIVWQTNYSASNGIPNVMVPEPSTIKLSMGALLLCLLRCNRPRYRTSDVYGPTGF